MRNAPVLPIERDRSGSHHRPESGPVVIGGRKFMVCQADLRTPNDWTNKLHGGRIYRRERSKWVKLLKNVQFLWGKQSRNVTRRLTVIRKVPNRRYLIKDLDNRVAALKPLLDALTIVGVIIDDAETFLESLPPVQLICPDLKAPVVEVLLEDI